MNPWEYVLLAVIGLVVGVVSIMAGGGSLVTMPVMIFMGLPPATANGTNRVALLVQSVAATTSFKKRGFSNFKLSMSLALCTIPGVLIGSVVAVRIDPLWFKRCLAGVMVAALLIIFRGKPGKKEGKGKRAHPVSAHLTMVAVGFYGGFIQAGVGFILVAILQGMLGLDLIRVNMHKVFIVGLYMIPSLLIFALSGNVDWLAGAVLAVGTGAGGWLGARLAVKGGERLIRIVLSVAVLAMAVKLLLG